MDTVTVKKKKLLRWGEEAFALARPGERSPRLTSEFVAITVGRQALRLGFSEQELKRWLQSAYSSLWVRQSNLNPGLDMKDIQKLTLQSFNNPAKKP